MSPSPSLSLGLRVMNTSPAGQSINPKLAGLIGRHGPQNKQPFMVAFFKATEVHLRSIRSTGGKQRSQNRSKTPKNQEALRMASVAGRSEQLEGTSSLQMLPDTSPCDLGRVFSAYSFSRVLVTLKQGKG
jgi:hypothetical protein